MDRSLSFCMATTFYPPYSYGGDAVHVYRLTNELARLGHRASSRLNSWKVSAPSAKRISRPRPCGFAERARNAGSRSEVSTVMSRIGKRRGRSRGA
jgi:hypothetical protein